MIGMECENDKQCARSGAAKLHLEGVAKSLPAGGGQPGAVVALALKRITDLRQAVFKVLRQSDTRLQLQLRT